MIIGLILVIGNVYALIKLNALHSQYQGVPIIDIFIGGDLVLSGMHSVIHAYSKKIKKLLMEYHSIELRKYKVV